MHRQEDRGAFNARPEVVMMMMMSAVLNRGEVGLRIGVRKGAASRICVPVVY